MTERKHVLVCANPDLNYIDGSSIWAQTITLALAETGQASVDFLARCRPERDELFSPLDRHPQVNVIDGPAQKDQGRTSLRRLSLPEMARLAVQMDRDHAYDLVIVRGYKIAQALKHNSHVLAKCWLYLTDIPQKVAAYDATELKEISDIARGCHRLLCQSQGFVRLWKELVPELSSQKFLLYTPVIPDADQAPAPISDRSRIAIYAGKFSPEWKTLEMAKAWGEIHRKYPDATLQMIGEKIHSDGAEFQSRMRMALRETPGLEWLGAMSREQVQSHLYQARVGLSWRSDRMNDTLEYSTKILEYGGAGCAAIMNRNPLHEELLGEDYPLFANSREHFTAALETAFEDDAVAQAAADELMGVAQQHLLSRRVKQLGDWLEQLPRRPKRVEPGQRETFRVVVAGHDLKFFNPIKTRLENTGRFDFLDDIWTGHNKHDEGHSKALLQQADIIVCEWCLGNLRWYSRNRSPQQRLIARFHLQERALPFLAEANWDSIDQIVYVSEFIRREGQKAFGFPKERTTVIPNYLDPDRFFERKKTGDARYTLGMIGAAPSRKRLDRAIDLLEELLEEDSRFCLHVKGRHPLEYDWLVKRPDELAYYHDLFKRINSHSLLNKRVVFDPPGDDVNEWLSMIGYILSPSDFESFHMAIGEAILAGCQPIIWDWDGAREIWGEEDVIERLSDAKQLILSEFSPPKHLPENVEPDRVIDAWSSLLTESALSARYNR